MPLRKRLVVLLLALTGIASGVGALSQDGHPPDHAQGMHGQGHAQNHDWYQQLKQPGTGYSCCNGSARGNEGDCRPTRAYQDDEGRWFALLNGRWVAIAPQVILDRMSPDGRSHLCANPYGRIFCFLRGSPRS